MITLKKVGLTALAGSLVAVSAQAGELAVTGSATATYKTKAGSGLTAQSLGHSTQVNFAGSGELDNGYTFNTFVLMADSQGALSSSALTLTMGSMGTVGISRAGGFNVNGGYDETYPRAYEENSDAGGQSPSNYVGSTSDDNAIIYKSPQLSMMGATVDIGVEYSLDAAATTGKDGAVAASTPQTDNSMGVGITVGYEGLTIGAYAEEIEKNDTNSVAGTTHDEFNGTAFINYNFGPVSVGYQQAYTDAGVVNGTAAANATTAAKTVGTSSGKFEDTSMSIAFNVNDDLSISYAETESEYDPSVNAAGTATRLKAVKQDSESFQVAYSMGAMSVKAYKTKISNINYVSGATDTTVNEIAIGLAF
jgi:outer membrane protein OmpU